MLRKPLLGTALASLLAVGISTSAQAATIGWNYVIGTGPGAGVELDADEEAGAPGYRQTNWNNHAGGGQNVGTVPFELHDGNGNASGVSVTDSSLSSLGSWSYDLVGGAQTADEKLMQAFVGNQLTITFSNLHAFTPDGYTVVVYYGNNEWEYNGFSALAVNDQVQNIRTNASLRDVGYILNNGTATSEFADTNQSNYAVFTGVTGDTLTVSVSTLSGVGSNGISAIQIVAIPEPASLALMGLGGMLMLRRKRD